MLVPQCFSNSTAVSMLNALFGHHPKRVAAIPDDAIASAILFCDRMVAKISERRKVLPVPPGASMKNSPPLCSVIARIILSYAMLCSRINCGRFVLMNVPSSSES
ncbi:hypothetical protein TNCV_4104291 [Trichonephila clavipes]|nr:hypothetical protein TNCV_4104291 [Trichonephila clavipes]